MKWLHVAVAACIAVSLAMVLQAEQGGAERAEPRQARRTAR